MMQRVDLALVLAVDASSSVDRAEFDLMIGGYAAAFREAEIVRALLSGPSGAAGVRRLSGRAQYRIAVTRGRAADVPHHARSKIRPMIGNASPSSAMLTPRRGSNSSAPPPPGPP